MSGNAMVLNDGGLAALIALAIASEETVAAGAAAERRDARAPSPSQSHFVAVVRGRYWSRAAELQERAVQAQAQVFGIEIAGGQLPPIEPPGDPSRGEAATQMLATAAYFALRSGCSRLIWPVHVDRRQGEEVALELAAQACDRALLMSRLTLLDASDAEVPEVTIETPLIDYEDEQLAELAVDLAIPAHTLWWWGLEDEAGLAAAESQRWLPLLHTAGLAELMQAESSQAPAS